MLKSKLLDKSFQNWLLIGWKHSYQPIKSYVNWILFTKMDIDKGLVL